MRWRNPTTSLVLPIPFELLCAQDEDGGIPPNSGFGRTQNDGGPTRLHDNDGQLNANGDA